MPIARILNFEKNNPAHFYMSSVLWLTCATFDRKQLWCPIEFCRSFMTPLIYTNRRFIQNKKLQFLCLAVGWTHPNTKNGSILNESQGFFNKLKRECMSCCNKNFFDATRKEKKISELSWIIKESLKCLDRANSCAVQRPFPAIPISDNKNHSTRPKKKQENPHPFYRGGISRFSVSNEV